MTSVIVNNDKAEKNQPQDHISPGSIGRDTKTVAKRRMAYLTRHRHGRARPLLGKPTKKNFPATNNNKTPGAVASTSSNHMVRRGQQKLAKLHGNLPPSATRRSQSSISGNQDNATQPGAAHVLPSSPAVVEEQKRRGQQKLAKLNHQRGAHDKQLSPQTHHQRGRLDPPGERIPLGRDQNPMVATSGATSRNDCIQERNDASTDLQGQPIHPVRSIPGASTIQQQRHLHDGTVLEYGVSTLESWIGSTNGNEEHPHDRLQQASFISSNDSAPTGARSSGGPNLAATQQPSDLAVARPVANEPSLIWASQKAEAFDTRAHEMKLQMKKKRRNRLLAMLGCLMLLIIAVILMSVIAVQRNNGGDTAVFLTTEAPTPRDENTPTQQPSEAPSLSQEEYILTLLPNFTLQTMQDNPKSAQALAYQWLVINNTDLDVYSDERLVQRFALATIYYALNGDEWHNNTNWLTDAHECEWHFQDFQITSYNTGSPLKEQFGDAVSCLFGETYINLWLDNNNLQGTLPHETFMLTSLKTLKMISNKIHGSIPEAGLLQNLTELSLSGNQLSGEIPPSLGFLTDMIWLNLGVNQLTGSVPTELGLLTNVEFGTLDMNLLTGAIPSTLGKMESLLSLILNDNFLTSTIPTTLGLLTNMDLGLHLSGNDMEGPVPSEIGRLTSLRSFQVQKNRLTFLPSELGLVSSNLELLYAEENNLTQSFYTELGQLTNLIQLTLSKNNLFGPIPSQLGNLKSLELFTCFDNSLSGTLPTYIGAINSLQLLAAFENQLEGSIPPELENLPDLFAIDLSDNAITGSLSPSLFRPDSKLEIVGLHLNRLTSTVPPQIGLVSSLRSVNLRNNSLTGQVPTQLENLQNLTRLSLSGNDLRGTIPSTLCTIEELSFDCTENLCGCDCKCTDEGLFSGFINPFGGGR